MIPTVTLLVLLSQTALADDPYLRIVGGTEAAPDDWPSAGAVLVDDAFQCTAVLVHPQVVLTAGHCDWGDLTHVLVDTVDLEAGERIAIAETHRYPNHYTTYDVSAVVLDSPATTEPIPLVRDCIRDLYLVNGATVHLVGFGHTDELGTQLAPGLMHATTLVTDHDCDDSDRGCNEAVLPGGEMIAGGAGIDTCSGDSGGPLYLETDAGLYLAGITSRGAKPQSTPCGDGGIYVRADAIAEWVELQTGFTLDSPDCSAFDNAAPVPTAEMLITEVDTIGHTRVLPNDPDSGDMHDFTIETPPRNGTALTGPSGDVAYIPDDGFVGTDTITVRVTDDGLPRASALLDIEVEVHWVDADTGDTGSERRGGCGCDAMGAASLAWYMLLLFGVMGLRMRQNHD